MTVPLIERAGGRAGHTAIRDDAGDHTCDELLDSSGRVAASLLGDAAGPRERPVAFMVAPGAGYVAAQWGIWRAGGIAVPLCLSHPPPEVEYVLRDTGAGAVIAGPGFEDWLRPLADAVGARLVPLDASAAGAAVDLPDVDPMRAALILYTSGTTSRPKGVVLTHANLTAQMECLTYAWGWTPADRILHVLPLHHTHGIVNGLLCALWAGAVCEMHPGFDAERVWDRFAAGGLTLFMAVPTIYSRLIGAWEAAGPGRRAELSAAAGALRLTVSGSAALPLRTFERWREITGHDLLERYGMTEIGMALSNPLHGERRPGTVGRPLPGVDVRLVDEGGRQVPDGAAGEIEVRGPGVFREYWNRADATREAFRDGWFRTGDVAVVEDGYYRILGRSSVDIIKTGGYKVSALEIEDALRSHPAVRDCAIVGVEDPEWGERVCAAVVPWQPSGGSPGRFEDSRDAGQPAGSPSAGAASPLDPDQMRAWLAERLAPYKLPRRWVVVDDLPRNVMGKVTKPEVKRLFA